MELAGLGDNVHLIPALSALRRHWPAAELHVMANGHVAEIFSLMPWINRVWAYPSSPRPRLAGYLSIARELRSARFDCAINTNGSDRSSLLTRATGALHRISRRPADGGPPGWSLLFTQTHDVPFHQQPMYLQKWEFMRAVLGQFEGAGPGTQPEFPVSIDVGARRTRGIGEVDDRRYLHLSPFTTSPARELPLEQLAQLVAGLRSRAPHLKVVLSCSPNPREMAGMDALLGLLRAPPWKVFRGTLGIPALASVIDGAALAFSGDTGGLHLAMMSGTPAVAWFRAHRGQREWIPVQPQYRVLTAEGGATDALQGISTEGLLGAAQDLLALGRR